MDAALEARPGAAKRVAEVCEVTEQAVSKWRRTGQITLENLVLAAAALDMQLTDFLEEDDQEPLTISEARAMYGAALDRRRGMGSPLDYPETAHEAARLLAAIPEPQRTHLVETIRMVYTATVAINNPTIAAMLPGIQDQERHEFYERWIEQKQAEYRAEDVKK